MFDVSLMYYEKCQDFIWTDGTDGGYHFFSMDDVWFKFFSLFLIEAKKSRSTGRPVEEPAPEETNKSVFVAFLREAGVTLRQNGTSNEIGKHTQFQIQIFNIQGE